MSNDPEPFEILPSGEMQQKYGLYAENRPKITLDPAKVPPELRDLIPLVEEFGVSDDIRRHDLGSKMTDAQKLAPSETLKGRHKPIYVWLRDESKKQPMEAYHFSQLCVFEMEECDGPGIPGNSTDIDAWYERYLVRRYGKR